MSKALVKRGSGGGSSGIVPGVASLVVPGSGQLINGEGDKAVGMFAVWGVGALGVLGFIPIVGWAAATAALATHVYAVVDAAVVGRKKR
jgi:TM2 domain-containing membrane protein YozV